MSTSERRYKQLARIATSGHLLTESERAEFTAYEPVPVWYVIINSDGLVLASYGSALGDLAAEKARALHFAPASVSLRLVKSRKRPAVGYQLAIKSKVVDFRQHGLDPQGWFPSLRKGEV